MANYLNIRKELRSKLRKSMSELVSKKHKGSHEGEKLNSLELRELIEAEVNMQLFGQEVSITERRQLVNDLLASFTGMDVLQEAMDDKSISEIMVNGPYKVFLERNGILELSPLAFDDNEHLLDVIRFLFSKANKNISLSRPIEDLRLKDGSRANAVLYPLAPDGHVLTIRKFSNFRPSAKALIDSGFVPEKWLKFLQAAVKDRKNIFISGGTGTGKTSLLNILSQSIPSKQRIVSIEDSCELQLSAAENIVRLECRSQNPDGKGEIGINELIRTALRMRPDRLIVGEVRGKEAYELLNAMNTGHRGTMSTAHANSCEDLLRRLSHIILQASRLPYEAIIENLESCIDYIVQIERLDTGKRRIKEIAELIPGGTSKFSLKSLYKVD